MLPEPIPNQAEAMERITSRVPLRPDETDPETLLLRESWSRLSQLLEAADETLDTDDFAQRVQLPDRPVGTRRRILAWVAIAASLLLCTMLFWVTRKSPQADPQTAAIAQVTVSESESVTPAASVGVEETAWDDTLDQRLANFSGALAIARGSTVRSDRHVSGLSSQLLQMAAEIDANSL